MSTVKFQAISVGFGGSYLPPALLEKVQCTDKSEPLCGCPAVPGLWETMVGPHYMKSLYEAEHRKVLLAPQEDRGPL